MRLSPGIVGRVPLLALTEHTRYEIVEIAMRFAPYVCVLLACSTLVPKAASADDGWTPLFNGRDLSGWQEIGGGQEPSWEVVDCVLSPAMPGGWLSTEREYDDFELRLEFNVSAGGNSGVYFRAPHKGRISHTGMEIQLIDELGERYADLKDWQKSGSLYGVVAPKPGAARRAGEWQMLTTRCVGRRLRVELNGQQVVDTDLDSHPDAEAEHTGLKRASGYIGLQNYNGQKVQFRNIAIRELDGEADR